MWLWSARGWSTTSQGSWRAPHGWSLFLELWLRPRYSGVSDLSLLLEKMLLLWAAHRREETVQRNLDEVMRAPHFSCRETVRPLPVSLISYPEIQKEDGVSL